MRLALDWGKARIGVAACDAAEVLAYPVETVQAGPGANARIAELVAEYEPGEVVVGLPVALDGAEREAAGYVRERVEELRPLLGRVPVRFVDERLTTATAARRLHQVGRSAKRQRGVIDQAAAVAILEQALAMLDPKE
ncbi:MAG: Holliday junction resolvase RuvX [Propionibacteriaceae bacterium]|nr:Holliday junction resolvase RuvX [Propionibacteriaceae bacterium]